MLVEVPVRNAIDACHHCRRGTKQRLHQVHHARHGVGFKRDEDVVLRPQRGRVVGAIDLGYPLLALAQQPQAVGAHGGKMGATCDQADLGARQCQLDAEIAADRAGAIDTHFHDVVSR